MEDRRTVWCCLRTLLFVVCMICAAATGTVNAEEVPSQEVKASEGAGLIAINSIEALPSNVASQKIMWPAVKDKIVLPSQLVTDQGNVQVEWKSNVPFDGDKIATYTFIPQFTEEFRINTALPKIKVTVTSAATKVTGISFKRTARAGVSLSDTIKVSPSYGAKVHLQQKNGGHWVTRRTYNAPQQQTANVVLKYTKDWYTKESSYWRVYIPKRAGASSYRSTPIKVTAKRVYQNPGKYLQIKQTVTVRASGGYNLKKGSMGLKVARVQRKLGMGRRWEIMDSATMNRVKVFQRKKGLKPTGIVDLKTWKKMGFSESSWISMGKYVSPVKIKMTSTREQSVETMIKTAKQYMGDEYIVGAAGKPGAGVDCSGLVMQSMYSAGLNPLPVSVVRHAQPGYEYESRNLWTHSKLKHVSYSQKKRGDLIFYRGRGGAIIHVAIYLGDGKVIESWPDKVRIWPVKNSHRGNIAGVIRPFV